MADIPVDVRVENIKRSLIRYINLLGNQYKIPTIVMTSILQEIVYETKLNQFSEAFQEMEITANQDATLSDAIPQPIESS